MHCGYFESCSDLEPAMPLPSAPAPPDESG